MSQSLHDAAVAALENDRRQRRRLKAALKPTYRVCEYDCAEKPNLRAVVRWKNAEGKWERKYFTTKGAAETFAQQRNTEILNQGREALEFSTELRVMAQRCDALLKAKGHTIEDATKHFLAFLAQRAASRLVLDAFQEYYAAKQSRGVCRKHLILVKCVTGRFSRMFPEKFVSDIETADCEAWLRTYENLSATSWNAYRNSLSEFFKWCIKRGYMAKNPAESIETMKTVETPVGILTPGQLGSLLNAADPQTLPYVAVGAFTGLRSAELHRLDWSEIDLVDGFIEVKALKAKSARRRVVKIQPVLAAWLRPFAKRSGPLVDAKSIFPALRLLWARAGIAEWPRNALRHSFASYHLAHFKNTAELALEMGHTGTALIFQHYRQVVREAEAAKYWNLMPKNPDNVLEMANENIVVRPETPYVHTLEGKFMALPRGAVYQKTAREYAAAFGVTEKACNHWMRQGRPLDDPQALARLARGEYAHTVEEHAEIYGVSVEQIRQWRRFAWPLDNAEGMKTYLSTRRLWRPKKTPEKQGKPVVRGKIIAMTAA